MTIEDVIAELELKKKQAEKGVRHANKQGGSGVYLSEHSKGEIVAYKEAIVLLQKLAREQRRGS